MSELAPASSRPSVGVITLLVNVFDCVLPPSCDRSSVGSGLPAAAAALCLQRRLVRHNRQQLLRRRVLMVNSFCKVTSQ